MIENYAGFVSNLQGKELLELLNKEKESCYRLSNAFLNKGKALSKHIDNIKSELLELENERRRDR